VVPTNNSATRTQATLGPPLPSPPSDQGGQDQQEAFPEERQDFIEHAGKLTGRVREKMAYLPSTIQNVADTVGTSDVMVCLMPVIVVAGFVVAVVGGCHPCFSGPSSGLASQ
jgi:hypothetical protein